MTKLEVAIKELKALDAFRVASIGSALLILLEGSQSTVRSLDHMRWAENRLVGSRESLRDLGEMSPKAAAIEVFITVAIEGIEELRQGIGRAA